MTNKDAEVVFRSGKAVIYVRMPNEYQSRGYVWICLYGKRCGEGPRHHGSINWNADFERADPIFNEGCCYRFYPDRTFNPFKWFFGFQTYERAIIKCRKYLQEHERFLEKLHKREIARERFQEHRQKHTKTASEIGKRIIEENF